MHTVVIKDEILERAPWVAVSLLQALQRSKEVCYERMRDPRSLALVWAKEELQGAACHLRTRPVALQPGGQPARARGAVRYEFEQGMIKQKPAIEELFFPPSLQEISTMSENPTPRGCPDECDGLLTPSTEFVDNLFTGACSGRSEP